ncbi:unnamed protein product [Phytomonas sp. Hart1]|nr:unnamed protein product [Phytomonas sp. Hart1]|eukprot:CCW69130.1 unnamed protein product [Phytomonas sp. isolate Hart1]
MQAYLTSKIHYIFCLLLIGIGVVSLEVRAERLSKDFYMILPLGVRIPFCVLTIFMAAFYCGMTLGLMKINTSTLEIIAESGPEADQRNARLILPLRRMGHQLLVTLLLGNMLAIVLTSQLIAAILNSSKVINFMAGTLVILIFGEIIPMCICCKGSNALVVGGKLIPALKVSLWIFYPIAKPLGMLLDLTVKHEPGQIFDRNEFKKLISMQYDKFSEKSGIDKEQVRMMLRVLELDGRTAKTIMTPLSEAFMLEGNMVLNYKLLKCLWNIGKSRLPVYVDERTNIVGVLYVKDLLNFFLLDHKVSTTVYNFVMSKARDIVVVDANLRIQEILAMFKNRIPHLLLVSNCKKGDSQVTTQVVTPVCAYQEGFSTDLKPNQCPPPKNIQNEESNGPFIGILTLEDVIEELIAAEIYDEDEYTDRSFNPNDAALTSSPTKMPPNYKLHVNFYSYGLEDIDQPVSGLGKTLLDEQKWVLADYITRMYVAFATWSVEDMKKLLDYVGDRIINVTVEISLCGMVSPDLILYNAGVQTDVFTLLLGGAAEMKVEKKLSTKVYSFFAFAEEVLLSDQSFVPNYTAVITRSSRVLQISRDDLRMAEEHFKSDKKKEKHMASG